jgi:toxin ParE1/3/4
LRASGEWGANFRWAVLAHIEEHSPQGVRNVQARIQEVIALIAAAPFIGRQTRKPNIRRFNTHPYPYLIFYQVTGSEIIIRRIRHGEGLHWPDLDEDVSVEALVAGRPSAESAAPLKRWLGGRGSGAAAPAKV